MRPSRAAIRPFSTIPSPGPSPDLPSAMVARRAFFQTRSHRMTHPSTRTWPCAQGGCSVWPGIDDVLGVVEEKPTRIVGRCPGGLGEAARALDHDVIVVGIVG